METVAVHGNSELRDVRVDASRLRRHTRGPELDVVEKVVPKDRRRSEFVYVNTAYVGSLNSVNASQNRIVEPPTSVIREQYWACSKWPFGQRVLAIAVGMLVGAVIGLAVTVALTGKDNDVIGGIFRSQHAAPD